MDRLSLFFIIPFLKKGKGREERRGGGGKRSGNYSNNSNNNKTIMVTTTIRINNNTTNLDRSWNVAKTMQKAYVEKEEEEENQEPKIKKTPSTSKDEK